MRWLRGRGAAVLSGRPHAALRGAFPRQPLPRPAHTARIPAGAPWAPLGPRPDPSFHLSPALPTPTQVAGPPGRGDVCVCVPVGPPSLLHVAGRAAGSERGIKALP